MTLVSCARGLPRQSPTRPDLSNSGRRRPEAVGEAGTHVEEAEAAQMDPAWLGSRLSVRKGLLALPSAPPEPCHGDEEAV